jgi:hypothetical protein
MAFHTEHQDILVLSELKTFGNHWSKLLTVSLNKL